jgi:hypothetical protein
VWVFCEKRRGRSKPTMHCRDPNTSKGGAVPFWGVVSDFVLDQCPKSVAAFRLVV